MLPGFTVTRYTLNGSDPFRPITIELVANPRTGVDKWAVRQGSNCLAKDGEWEYEPQPSSRDDAFLDRCRYKTLEEANAVLQRALAVNG